MSVKPLTRVSRAAARRASWNAEYRAAILDAVNVHKEKQTDVADAAGVSRQDISQLVRRDARDANGA